MIYETNMFLNVIFKPILFPDLKIVFTIGIRRFVILKYYSGPVINVKTASRSIFVNRKHNNRSIFIYIIIIYVFVILK